MNEKEMEAMAQQPESQVAHSFRWRSTVVKGICTPRPRGSVDFMDKLLLTLRFVFGANGTPSGVNQTNCKDGAERLADSCPLMQMMPQTI